MSTYTDAEILDHRRQWLAALRDPDRKQVKNVLCRLDDDGNAVGYCCLGVAADVADTPWQSYASTDYGIVREYENEYGGASYSEYGGASYEVLPKETAGWLGLGSEAQLPDLNRPHDGHSLSLAGLNDEGLSFAEIAELIEEFGLKNDPHAHLGWR